MKYEFSSLSLGLRLLLVKNKNVNYVSRAWAACYPSLPVSPPSVFRTLLLKRSLPPAASLPAVSIVLAESGKYLGHWVYTTALHCAANTKIHHIIAFIKTRGYFQLSRHTLLLQKWGISGIYSNFFIKICPRNICNLSINIKIFSSHFINIFTQ